MTPAQTLEAGVVAIAGDPCAAALDRTRREIRISSVPPCPLLATPARSATAGLAVPSLSRTQQIDCTGGRARVSPDQRQMRALLDGQARATSALDGSHIPQDVERERLIVAPDQAGQAEQIDQPPCHAEHAERRQGRQPHRERGAAPAQ